jgi:indole-3-glycerol phosphate synthase
MSYKECPSISDSELQSAPVATYLDRILERHRALAAQDTRQLDVLLADAHQMPPARGFRSALQAGESLAVISEIKRRSPSKGDLNPDLDPASMAKTYEAGGAACLSVLTDEEFFGGSVADLQAARAACALPVLRKDFTVAPSDVADARLMGADCLLLIVAAMRACMLSDLHALAVELGLDVLVEVHDEHDLEAALHAEATMIGVNQRDLYTFEVDHERAVRLAGVIPDGVVKIAESGVRGADDARMLSDAGYDAILVGETLVTAADPRSAIVQMRVRPT